MAVGLHRLRRPRMSRGEAIARSPLFLACVRHDHHVPSLACCYGCLPRYFARCFPQAVVPAPRRYDVRIAIAMASDANYAVTRSTPSSAFYPLSKHTNHRWVPSLFFWGATSGVLVTLALSGVPLFKKDVLLNTPVVRILAAAWTGPDTMRARCAFFFRHRSTRVRIWSFTVQTRRPTATSPSKLDRTYIHTTIQSVHIATVVLHTFHNG